MRNLFGPFSSCHDTLDKTDNNSAGNEIDEN